MTAPMTYREVAPTVELATVVASWWEFVARFDSAQPFLHRIPLDGCVSLAYARSANGSSRMVYVGPRTEPLVVPIFPGDIFWGVRLMPGCSRCVLGVSGAEWSGKSGLLEVGLSDDLRRRLDLLHSLEDAAGVLSGALLPSLPPVDVLKAVRIIVESRGSLKIGDLALRLGFSERQVLRMFREEVGLTPKQFARICRVRAAALDALKGHSNWGTIAAERGFADQAHLTHEFQELFGITPSQFEAEILMQIQHVGVGEMSVSSKHPHSP